MARRPRVFGQGLVVDLNLPVDVTGSNWIRAVALFLLVFGAADIQGAHHCCCICFLPLTPISAHLCPFPHHFFPHSHLCVFFKFLSLFLKVQSRVFFFFAEECQGKLCRWACVSQWQWDQNAFILTSSTRGNKSGFWINWVNSKPMHAYFSSFLKKNLFSAGREWLFSSVWTVTVQRHGRSQCC